MMKADAAEAKSDAASALRLMNSMPNGPDGRPFWRPWRLRGVAQIVGLGPLLPRWVTSRWILAQALQGLSEPSRGRTGRALQVATRVRGGRDEPTGVDETDATCKVIDRDWVFRQVFLYELGGLDDFLRRAAPALVDPADRIRGWARAQMGGYQLVGHDSATVTWQDLATGERFDVANNGCGVLVVPGECVIGRRVPIDGGSMFETVPLLVPRPLSERVARAPTDWIEALAEAYDDVLVRTGGHTFELLSDVPPVVWLSSVLDGRWPAMDAAPTEAVAKAVIGLADELLAAPPDDPEELDPEALNVWPCLAAAVLEPDVCTARSWTDGSAQDTLRRLSQRLAEPAASVCQALVEGPRDAA